MILQRSRVNRESQFAVKRVAVIGSKGFVGAHICQALGDSGEYRAIPVSRGDDLISQISSAEIVVHAANPAKRFRASKDPQLDFEETVEKTFRFLDAAAGRKFILISSFSCRTQMDTEYGRHRRACELLALLRGSTVIRLGPMYGGSRTQDTLHDILAGRPVYVSSETRYAYADVGWVGRRIVDHLAAAAGVFEIGPVNAVRLRDLAALFRSPSIFSGPDDTQIPEGVLAEGADARDVFSFAAAELARIDEWRS